MGILLVELYPGTFDDFQLVQAAVPTTARLPEPLSLPWKVMLLWAKGAWQKVQHPDLLRRVTSRTARRLSAWFIVTVPLPSSFEEISCGPFLRVHLGRGQFACGVQLLL